MNYETTDCGQRGVSHQPAHGRRAISCLLLLPNDLNTTTSRIHLSVKTLNATLTIAYCDNCDMNGQAPCKTSIQPAASASMIGC